MELEKVFAVILNYNTIKDTMKCINFIKKQDYKNLDIIVVDNSSSDQDEIFHLEDFCLHNNVHFIRNDSNSGYSAGNNIGMRYAIENGADWCLILNPDVELRNISYISEVMRMKNEYSNIGAIGTNIINPDGSRQNPSRNLYAYEELFSCFEVIRQKIGKKQSYLTDDVSGYCEKIHGCCLFLDKKFLEKANFLDEKVFLYCEEPILSKQIFMNGYKCLYLKELTANHEHYSKKKSGSSSQRMLQFLESRKYYIKTYSGYSLFWKSISLASRTLESCIWKMRR